MINPKYCILTSVSILALFLLPAAAQTRISGEITSSMFNTEAGPFIVEKDIFVPQGKQVEIPAGSVLLFSAFTGLVIDGRIKANGTAFNPVVFTSVYDPAYNQNSNKEPAPFDWTGILVSSSSKGSYFNNIKLCFSEYGIKSQSSSIFIQNSFFKQNGKFHFTLFDNIQYIQENIPYSYGGQTLSDDQNAKKTETKHRQTATTDRSKGSTSSQTKAFRFSCLGVGLAGAGLGVFFNVRAARRSEIVNNWDIHDPAANPSEYYKARKEHPGNLAGACISYSIGFLALTGFAITFAF
jgi:hypothetical protein